MDEDVVGVLIHRVESNREVVALRIKKIILPARGNPTIPLEVDADATADLGAYKITANHPVARGLAIAKNDGVLSVKDGWIQNEVVLGEGRAA